MVSVDNYMIQTPTSEWSLIGFLTYRKRQHDFTKSKDKEHYKYQMSLYAIQSSDSYTKAEKDRARDLLANFKDEVDKEIIQHFWIKEKQDVNVVLSYIFFRCLPCHLLIVLFQVKVDVPRERSKGLPNGEGCAAELLYTTAQEVGKQSQIIQQGITSTLRERDDFMENTRNKKQKTRVGMILPDGTVLPKPPPQPDFTARDDEDESSISVDDVDEEGIPQLDVVTDFMSTKAKKWALPSGKNVTDVVDINISQLAKSTKNKEKLTAVERATLRYCVSGLIDLSAHMRNWFSADDLEFMKKDYKTIMKPPDFEKEVNIFITEVEKMVRSDLSKAYKFCIERHANSVNNTCIYKISKIYGDFLFEVIDGTDMLECGKEIHTEVDVIAKACSYIVKGLIKGLNLHYKWGESFCPSSKSTNFEKGRKCDVRFLSISGIDLGEWEFSAHATATKAIEDRCRSARINQSILNSMLKLGLSDEQTKITKVQFLQIAGTYGQVLLEDLVNGFYVVIPGLSFELPTKLSQIQKLRSAETYEEIGNMLDGLDYGPNKLDSIFGINHVKLSHYKSEFIREPWWSPKTKTSSQLSIAVQKMDEVRQDVFYKEAFRSS
ncbi:6650_t:CDS:2 [Gigaspora margarita]|uniref:6650_t:CDS:1 n=1 Tax=Gigaspora margarita TaxID=4874 RepID=A0ABN7VCZ9_GIGMA|nr:6650_t:CDS:2 [Gigaspora margarita]